MNRLIFILILLTLFPSLFSQNLKLAGSVVAAAGNYSSSSSSKLSWTMGEPVVDYLEASAYTLAVGFQQNWDKIVGIEDTEHQWQIKIYPNPVADKVFISFDKPGSSQIYVEILTLTGGKVFFGNLKTLAEGELATIDVASLKTGLYFLHIFSPMQKTNRVFKIIKQ
jgi:Secretion system C-terminal sorting domain